MIDLFEPYVTLTWNQMVTQSFISTLVTINQCPLLEKATKRMPQLYPYEILRVCGIFDLVEEASSHRAYPWYQPDSDDPTWVIRSGIHDSGSKSVKRIMVKIGILN